MSANSQSLPGGQARRRTGLAVSSAAARAAARKRWDAVRDTRKATQAARDAAAARFLALVDPEGQLSEEEREHRANLAKRAHMLRMAQLSVDARKRAAR